MTNVLGINLEGQTPLETKPEELLSSMVGEGKKYATLDEAAVALAKKVLHSENFIDTLKKEKQDLQMEYESVKATSKGVNDILEVLSKKGDKPLIDPPQNQTVPKEVNIEEQVAAILKAREAEAEAARKDAATRNKLIEAFGGEHQMQQVLLNFVGDSDDKKELVTKVGRTSPDLLVKMLKEDKTVESMTISGTEGPSSGTSPQYNGLTMQECLKVKRSNPNLYHSLTYQQKMNEAATNHPNEFFKK